MQQNKIDKFMLIIILRLGNLLCFFDMKIPSIKIF